MFLFRFLGSVPENVLCERRASLFLTFVLMGSVGMMGADGSACSGLEKLFKGSIPFPNLTSCLVPFQILRLQMRLEQSFST